MYSQIFSEKTCNREICLPWFVSHVPKFDCFKKCLFKQHIINIPKDTLLEYFQWDWK